MIVYQKFIYRADLQANPEVVYLFGDNLTGEGLAGQAGEMRGEPNAIGIPTKAYPNMEPSSFFSDDDLESNKAHILAAIASIPVNVLIICPLDGLGTGLAQLPYKAPKTNEFLSDILRELEETEVDVSLPTVEYSMKKKVSD